MLPLASASTNPCSATALYRNSFPRWNRSGTMQKLKRLPLLQRASNTLRTLLKPVSELLTVHVKLPKRQMMAALIAALALLCAIFFLAGCTTTRVVRPPLPPQAEPREIPSFQGQTYRDVILYVIELREAAQQSEADKAAIRRLYK